MQYAPLVSTVTTDADWNFSNLDTNCSWFLRSMFQQRMIASYWKGILANITSLHSHQSIPTMYRTDAFGVSELLIKALDSLLMPRPSIGQNYFGLSKLFWLGQNYFGQVQIRLMVDMLHHTLICKENFWAILKKKSFFHNS